MLKKYLILALIITVIPLFSTSLSQAAPNNVDLPEQAGVYDVPGNFHLKLRVFVHPANNQNYNKPTNSKGKPTPPLPSEICSPTSTVDLNSQAIVTGAGWTLPSTWTYNLNLSSVPSTIGSDNLVMITNNAFNSWLAIPTVGEKVNIVSGNKTTVTKAQRDSNNIITWGRTSGSALAISYIWYNTLTRVATEIDTIMNQKYTWYWSNPANWPDGQTCAFQGVYDAQNILTHELGHTMGLDDEYTDEYVNNTMYGYGSTGETKKDTLTTGDKIGAANLY
jgi:hypothetical protein